MTPPELQTTIDKPISLEGKGIHKGVSARVTFQPAGKNTGVVFRRIDLPDRPIIPASISVVSGVERGTKLGTGGAVVHTVEHLLSAVYGMGIHNLIVDLDGEEPPGVDGSSLPYVKALIDAGKKTFDEPAPLCRLDETFWIEEGDKSISYIPADHLQVSFTVEYPNSVISRQTRSVAVNEETYKNDIACARTFGFFQEYEALKARGLALGGGFDNAIVIGPDGKVMNAEGLRHEQEFVLHKILDIIGDLALTGRRILGHIVACKTGHAMNVKFAKMVCERFRRQEEKKRQTMLNIEEIKAILPHRYPFLLVDKIISLEPGKTAVGIKNVTTNEEFFNGHFPARAVMPGVLMIEAMAQVAGVLFLSQPEHKGKLPYFVGIDRIRFRKPVVPGDRLELSVKVLKVRGNTGKVEVEAKVESDLVASGELMFTIL